MRTNLGPGPRATFISPGEALRPADAFHFVLGEWSLERSIDRTAVMQGKAHVRLLSSGLAEYVEQVRVRTPAGASFKGTQRYLYESCADGFILYRAETGALFQQLRFTAIGDNILFAKAEHRCAADAYKSQYRLSRTPEGTHEISIVHAVRGPRKQYESRTTLRLEQPSA